MRGIREVGAGLALVFALGAAPSPSVLPRASSLELATPDASSSSSSSSRAATIQTTLDSARRLLTSGGGRASLLDGRGVERFEPGEGSLLRAVMRGASPEAIPRAARVELPSTAAGKVQIADPESGMRVEVTLRDATQAPFEEADGIAVYRDALGPGSDRFHRVTREGAEDLVMFARAPAREELVYEVDMGGVAGLRLVSSALELLDSSGVPRLRMAPPFIIDGNGRRFEAKVSLGPEGACTADTSPLPPWGRPIAAPCADAACHCELRVSWSAAGLAYPALVDPTWTKTTSMAENRLAAAAASLPNGEVLVTGGRTSYFPTDVIATTEMFNPVASAWAMGPPMSVPRSFHTATVLADGRVLVAGGTFNGMYLKSTEITAPDGALHDAGAMSTPHHGHTATLLVDGRVLVAGGELGDDAPTAKCDVFDPVSGWKGVAPMQSKRAFHSANRLADGHVLVAGGYPGLKVLKAVEAFDPVLEKWTVKASMTSERYLHRAVSIQGGILVMGGRDSADTILPSAEIFVPSATPDGPGVWTPTASMHEARAVHTATLLLDGRVLVAGGSNGNKDPAGTEVFAPGSTGSWSDGGDLLQVRTNHVAALLPGGNVLLTGGEDNGVYLREAEIFSLLPGGSPCTGPGECVSALCAAGVCCDKPCTGFCVACTAAEKGSGADGVCEVLPGKTCSPYACEYTPTCPESCVDDLGCAEHFQCVGSVCVPAPEAVCDGEHTLVHANGTLEDCTPFNCTSATTCPDSCAAAYDCVAPFPCRADGTCGPSEIDPSEGSSDGCSCSLARSSEPTGAGLGLGLALFAIACRRSLRRRTTGAALAASGLLLGCAPADEPAVVDSSGARDELRAIQERFLLPGAGPVVAAGVVDHFDPAGVRLTPSLHSARSHGLPTVRVELPRRASGQVRLEDELRRVAVSFAMAGAYDAPITIADGIALYPSGGPSGGSLVRRVHLEGTEDFLVFESRPEAEEIRYVFETEGIAGLRQIGGTLEMVDASGAPRLRVRAPSLVSAVGERRAIEAAVTLHGCDADASPAPPWGRPPVPPCPDAPRACRCELVIDWKGRGLEYPAILDPDWTITASMAHARHGATASPWPPDGMLVVGGMDATGPLDSSEIYRSGAWAMGPSLVEARTDHAASVLTDGRVIVSGGRSGAAVLSSLELLDPDDPLPLAWKAAGQLTVPRTAHAAAVLPLPDEQLLVVGGFNASSEALFDTDVCNPATVSCAPTGPLNIARGGATATRLDDGRVLAVGGELKLGFEPYPTCELFSWATGTPPATGSWAPGPKAKFVHAGHSATLLADGRVLVVGDDAEIFSPAHPLDTSVDAWGPTSGFGSLRRDHTATLLANGDVLLAGGMHSGSLIATSERIHAATGVWSLAGTLVQPRYGHVASRLGDTVVVAGGAGFGAPTPFFSSAEVLAQRPEGATCDAETDCRSGFCTLGICCDEACSAACSACDGASTGLDHDGTCAPRLANPCKEYRCDAAGSCPLGCATNETCAPTFICSGGACVPEPLVCDGDHTLRDSVGNTHDCWPYVCTVENACRVDCTAQYECGAGATCQADKHCGKPEVDASVGADGGCVCNQSKSSPSLPWLAISAALVVLRERARLRRRRVAFAVARRSPGNG